MTAPVAVAAATPTLSVGDWWEKVTVKMTGDGTAQTCRYETNLPSGGGAKDCKVVGASATVASQTGASSKEEYSTITFERRFSIGGSAPAERAMQTGDKLLGRDVMALAIDGSGKVSGCKMVLSQGETGLDYGCTEASAERFEASATGGSEAHRQGFLTVLVYGHNEHMV
jgi:hypothetical protein